MKNQKLRDFILNEVRNIMNERPEKYSSFSNNFFVSNKERKEVTWKKNDMVFIDKRGIKYLDQSLSALMSSNTKSVSGAVKLNNYDEKKQTVKFNDVKVSTDIIKQLARVGVHEFGPY